MSEKSGRGGAPQQTINLGECATIYGARNGYTVIGAALLAAAMTNHERGNPGRMSA